VRLREFFGCFPAGASAVTALSEDGRAVSLAESSSIFELGESNRSFPASMLWKETTIKGYRRSRQFWKGYIELRTTD
jgi:hypothetical protein